MLNFLFHFLRISKEKAGLSILFQEFFPVGATLVLVGGIQLYIYYFFLRGFHRELVIISYIRF